MGVFTIYCIYAKYLKCVGWLCGCGKEPLLFQPGLLDLGWGENFNISFFNNNALVLWKISSTKSSASKSYGHGPELG